MEEAADSKKVNSVFYRTSAQTIGSRAMEHQPKSDHGKCGWFSQHLLDSGMWKNNGLNTRVDIDKFVDGSKDWMDKIN